MTKQRVRRGEPAPGRDSLILRGYPLTEEVLRDNATDNHDVYGFYGISVFCADSPDEVDHICATKLRTLITVGLFRVEDLLARDLLLWDTGAAPHYHVVRAPDARDLSGLILRMLATPWAAHPNPHYREGEGR